MPKPPAFMPIAIAAARGRLPAQPKAPSRHLWRHLVDWLTERASWPAYAWIAGLTLKYGFGKAVHLVFVVCAISWVYGFLLRGRNTDD